MTVDFPEAAKTYPRFVLIGLCVFSFAELVVAILRRIRRKDANKEEQAPTAAPDRRSLLALIAGSAILVIAIPIIGFAVSVSVFLVVALGLLIGWKLVRSVVVVVAVVVVYFGTTLGLGIPLPHGITF
jgi:hypothetical protein